jgi:hypothetical protein
MGRTHYTDGTDTIWSEHLKGRHNSDVYIAERAILKWTVKKQNARIWTGLSWFNAGLFGTWFLTRKDISQLEE